VGNYQLSLWVGKYSYRSLSYQDGWPDNQIPHRQPGQRRIKEARYGLMETEFVFIDKKILCKDCHLDFVWEANEQRFYASKGLLPPKRCSTCRAIRKATIALKGGEQR